MCEKIKQQLAPLTPEEQCAYGIVGTLREKGHEAYVVGGAVRDRLLQRTPGEVDVATSADPEMVQALFPRTYAFGAAFGVVIAIVDNVQIEVATFRKDAGYHNGRHPDAVEFSDVCHDAERRDFTINAMFYDPAHCEIIDFVGGVRDLRRGIIRAIGNPSQRFAEDYLRMLRAVRFAARFNFELEAETAGAIRQHAGRIVQISPERVFAELNNMLTGPYPDRAFELLDELDLLRQLLPEVHAMKGVRQPAEFHPEGDVFIHTLLLLRALSHPDGELAWSALLHDVGKPPTFEIGKRGRESFPCHARVGADMTERILRRLRCSRAFIDHVREAVHNHMTFAEIKNMRQSTLRRLMARETFAVELELHRADCAASHRKLGNYVHLLDKLHEFRNQPPVPEPLLRGHDVLARGVPEGPDVGVILKELEELQLNGEVTTRDAALEWLARRVA